jgi:hypothetical protein
MSQISFLHFIFDHSGNAIASLVSRLRLERNIIVLRLHNLYAEDSDEEEEGVQEGANKSSSSAKPTESSSRMRTVEVEVDLSMSAYANVARMYGHKKVAQAKEIKTLEVTLYHSNVLFINIRWFVIEMPEKSEVLLSCSCILH